MLRARFLQQVVYIYVVVPLWMTENIRRVQKITGSPYIIT